MRSNAAVALKGHLKILGPEEAAPVLVGNPEMVSFGQPVDYPFDLDLPAHGGTGIR